MRKENKERNERIIALWDEGYTSTYIAKQLGITLGAAYKVCLRKGKKRVAWGKNPLRVKVPSIPHRDDIRADFDDGKSYHKIADKYGISYSSAWRMVNERSP